MLYLTICRDNITDPTPAPPRKGRVQEGSGYRSRYAQQFPSLQGEGQGWGLYCYFSCLLSLFEKVAAKVLFFRQTALTRITDLLTIFTDYYKKARNYAVIITFLLFFSSYLVVFCYLCTTNYQRTLYRTRKDLTNTRRK